MAWVPVMPPAPGWFSITTLCPPSMLDRGGATARVMVSTPEPGPTGRMILSGRSGTAACASAERGSPAQSASAASRARGCSKNVVGFGGLALFAAAAVVAADVVAAAFFAATFSAAVWMLRLLMQCIRWRAMRRCGLRNNPVIATALRCARPCAADRCGCRGARRPSSAGTARSAPFRRRAGHLAV